MIEKTVPRNNQSGYYLISILKINNVNPAPVPACAITNIKQHINNKLKQVFTKGYMFENENI